MWYGLAASVLLSVCLVAASPFYVKIYKVEARSTAAHSESVGCHCGHSPCQSPEYDTGRRNYPKRWKNKIYHVD